MSLKEDQDQKPENYVRQMAKQFEQITANSTTYTSLHEQCNWWLKTPSRITCFDEPINNTDMEQRKSTNSLLKGLRMLAKNGSEIETAEIASEQLNADCTDSTGTDLETSRFYFKIDQCLRFANKMPSKETINDDTEIARYFPHYLTASNKFILFLMSQAL